jgi:chitin disaccharide deacetylase
LKRLVVNADDFGYARDVNAGIIEAHTRGILTATTLMANGNAFDDAVRLARDHPELDIGCHLVLVGGQSLLSDGARLPASVPELLKALALRRIDPYAELRAQVIKILATGIKPTHLDTHKHTHLAPPVLEAVARLSQEFEIRWVRRPFDFPLNGGTVPLGKRAVSRSLQVLRKNMHRKLSSYGCLTTDFFAGFQLTGYLHTSELVAILRALPEGLTEFMCHPGHCTDELRASPTRLKESRERELEALVAREVRGVLETDRIELARYRDL